MASDRAEALHENVLKFAQREYPRLRAGDTIGQALARLRETQFQGQAIYFYVTDDEGRLVGVVSTRKLLLSPPETRLADVVERHVIALPDHATLEDACDMFILHRLLALPIVDTQGRMVGVIEAGIYTGEVMRLLDSSEEEHSADLFQLIGLHLEEIRSGTAVHLARNRLAWLGWNFAGGIICAALATFFKPLFAQWVVFALFMPVVLALAESTSIQTLTTILERHHHGVTSGKSLLRMAQRELSVGLLLALGLGMIMFLVVLGWTQRTIVATTMATSLAAGVFTAACLGFGVPAILLSLRRNPQLASGPIVLAATDLVTLLAYLGLGTLILL